VGPQEADRLEHAFDAMEAAALNLGAAGLATLDVVYPSPRVDMVGKVG